MTTWGPIAWPIAAVLLGMGLPWLTVRMLEPALEAGTKVVNYRGRPVHSGLGVAWLIWSGSTIAFGAAALWLAGDSGISRLLVLTGLMAAAAFAFGLFDDAYGSGDSRGFRGHLGAMSRARLTTGGLKLIGISVAAYGVALAVSGIAPWGSAGGSEPAWLAALPAGAAIALTSNLLNLADLRPGRALKLYLLLAALGVASLSVGGIERVGLDVSEVATLAAFCAGPVVATWGPDLGERGMAGDSGANAAGAVAGTLIVAGLSTAMMLSYLVVVLALNLASEKISFSRVIEGNAILRRIDAIGRTRTGAAGYDAGAIESVRHDDR